MRARLFVLVSFVILAVSPAWAQPNVLPNQVLLCSLPDGLGQCHSVFLKPGMRQNPVPELPPKIAGEANSIFFGSDVLAVFFRDSDFQSPSGVLSQNARNVSGNIYGSTHSLIVIRKTKDNPELGDLVGALVEKDNESSSWPNKLLCVVLGEQLQVENRCLFKPGDGTPFAKDPYEGTHRHLSLKLLGLAEAELIENADFSGRRVQLPGLSGKSEFELSSIERSQGWIFSSMLVRYSGNKRADRVEMQLPAKVMSPEAGEHRPPPEGAKQAMIPGQIALPPGSSFALQHDTNIQGGDYKNFDLTEPRPELCRDACREDGRCRAFTYVKPGIQGKQARCWLKQKASPPKPAQCCVSGVKP